MDEELARGVAALSNVVRGRGPGGPGRPPPFDDRGPRLFKDGPGERFKESGGPPPFGPRGPKPPFEEEGGRGGPRRHHEFFREGGPGGGPRREIRLSDATASFFDETRTNGFYFAFWSRSGSLMRSASNAPASLIWPGEGGRDTQPHTMNRDGFRETYQFTEFGECVLAGRWVGDDLRRLDRFAWLLLGAGAAILALGLGGSWSLARQAVRPVEQISATASRISAGNLSERINVEETEGELGRLASVLNSTFSRLESAFSRQKQFTADASHELRTPLAVMISEAQTTLARPREAAEYRETVEACLEAAQEMRRLTDSMLQLARLEAAPEEIERVPVDLAALAAHAEKLVQPLAEEQDLRITSRLDQVQVLADSGFLTQVITNLLNNAIHYNQPSGTIEISTCQQGDQALLTVSDTGLGISAEDLPHIFERFYRGDKARSSKGGGRMGLGLSICKTIVDLHGGTLEVTSELGVGTRFVVKLPLA